METKVELLDWYTATCGGISSVGYSPRDDRTPEAYGLIVASYCTSRGDQLDKTDKERDLVLCGSKYPGPVIDIWTGFPSTCNTGSNSKGLLTIVPSSS